MGGGKEKDDEKEENGGNEKVAEDLYSDARAAAAMRNSPWGSKTPLTGRGEDVFTSPVDSELPITGGELEEVYATPQTGVDSQDSKEEAMATIPGPLQTGNIDGGDASSFKTPRRGEKKMGASARPTAKLEREWEGHNGEPVRILTFSRCGDFLASSSGNCTLYIWAVETGSLLTRFEIGSAVTALAWMGGESATTASSARESLLIVCGLSKEVTMCCVVKKVKLATWFFSSAVISVEVDSTGHRCIAGTDSGDLLLIRVDHDEEEEREGRPPNGRGIHRVLKGPVTSTRVRSYACVCSCACACMCVYVHAPARRYIAPHICVSVCLSPYTSPCACSAVV
eukprot:GHVU01105500.1.p1 GENE.GHVU01105500.1~~GHVU01105500.1.p1  ORF type:complete len:340 (-),score=47.04 GHVU01105500.1:1093-2112(-)